MEEQTKRFTDRDWLYNKYVCERLTEKQIADICNGAPKEVIRHYLKKFKIHRKRMPKASQRRRNKVAALNYKGGVCALCGYDRCNKSFEFHHVEPVKKRFTISQGLQKQWQYLKRELDKCILLCKNCHVEVHSGVVDNQTVKAAYYRTDPRPKKVKHE